MRILSCMFLATLASVAAVRGNEPNPDQPVLTLPGRVVVESAGTAIGELSGGTLAVAFSSDGKRLAAAFSRRGADLAKQPYLPLTTNDLPSAWSAIKVWDAQSGKELRDQLFESGAIKAAFSPDGQRIATVWFDDPSKSSPAPVITLRDLTGGKELLSLKGPEGRVESIAISSNEKFVVAGGTHFKVWDASTGEELHTLVDLPGEPFCLGFSSDNTRLAVGTRNLVDKEKVNGIRGEARFWDLPTGKHVATWTHHGQYVRSLAYSPDGKRLALGTRTLGKEPPVRICDAGTGKELLNLPSQGTDSGDAQAQHMAFSPDGRLIAVVLSEQDKTAVKVWDAKTGKLLRTLPADDADSCLAFAPHASLLAVGRRREVTVWEIVQ